MTNKYTTFIEIRLDDKSRITCNTIKVEYIDDEKFININNELTVNYTHVRSINSCLAKNDKIVSRTTIMP